MNTQIRRRFTCCNPSHFLAVLFCFALAAGRLGAADPALASGEAKGTLATKGEKAATLAFAAAFVDVKDEEKPTIVIISDKKIPVEKWTSEFDMIEAEADLAFTGIVFFINKDGDVFRTDMHWKGKQTGVAGVFDVKVDSAKGAKEITGTAKSTGTDP